MVVESWITPEETPALAAEARLVIDRHLARLSETARAAYWASIRKAYNTPYNPPAKTIDAATVTVALPAVDCPIGDPADIAVAITADSTERLPVAAMARALSSEAHVA